MSDQSDDISTLLRIAAGKPAPEESEPEPTVGSADGGVRANPPKPPPDLGRLLRIASRGWDDEG